MSKAERIQKAQSGPVRVETVAKPWGHEKVWARSDRYVGKIIHINAGHELSVQFHRKKDETIHLLSGEIIFRVQSDPRDQNQLENVRLEIGESFRVSPGTVHQMLAVTDCDVLEVSTPETEDVVRLSDRYGREGTSAP